MLLAENDSRRRFLLGLMMFAGVGLAVIAGVLAWLWNTLESYEANTPESSVRRYLKQAELGQWDELYESSGFEPTAFTGREEYIAFLQNLYGEPLEDFTLVRTAGEGDLSYLLMSQGREISRLELREAPEGFRYRWQVRTRVEPLAPVTVQAPEGVRVLINGREADRSTATAAPAAGYEGLPAEVAAPQVLSYTIEGLLLPPQVTAEGEDQGLRYTVTGPEEETEMVFRVEAEPDPADADGYWKAAEAAAKAYAAFITADVSRTELNRYLLPGTPFYDSMQEFYNGWYIEHTGNEYRNISRGELRAVSADAFRADLSFDYVIFRGAREYVYPSSYRMYFLRTENGWKMTSLATR